MDYQIVIDLQERRVTKTELEEQLELAQADLQSTPQYARVQSLQEQIAAVRGQLDSLREELDKLALADYNLYGEREIAPGVNIRVERKVLYDLSTARQWCFANYPMALELNVRMFDREMKHVDKHASEDVGLPTFVKIEDDPKVTVASDLQSKILFHQKMSEPSESEVSQ